MITNMNEFLEAQGLIASFMWAIYLKAQNCHASCSWNVQDWFWLWQFDFHFSVFPSIFSFFLSWRLRYAFEWKMCCIFTRMCMCSWRQCVCAFPSDVKPGATLPLLYHSPPSALHGIFPSLYLFIGNIVWCQIDSFPLLFHFQKNVFLFLSLHYLMSIFSTEQLSWPRFGQFSHRYGTNQRKAVM